MVNLKGNGYTFKVVWGGAGEVGQTRYTTVSIDSISGQQRSSSACANAQADHDLRCPQIA